MLLQVTVQTRAGVTSVVSGQDNAQHGDLKSTGRTAVLAQEGDRLDRLRRRAPDLRCMPGTDPFLSVPLPSARVLHVRTLHRAGMVLRMPDLRGQHGPRSSERILIDALASLPADERDRLLRKEEALIDQLDRRGVGQH